MSTKVKGLLKGLRYISQMFDEKEPEMKIGLPTDVKHVAHIGWDGSSANKPSWMNEFQSPSELANGPLNSLEEVDNLSALPPTGGDSNLSKTEKLKHRSRRPPSGDGSSRHSRRPSTSSSTGSPANSPRGSESSKHSRRRRSSTASIDSPTRDTSGSSRSSRRHQSLVQGCTDSQAPEQPSIPKHSRGKKSKGPSSSSGSTRKSRSKELNSSNDLSLDPGLGGSESVQGKSSTANHLNSVLEVLEQE